ncbi:Na/Pi symporter [Pararhodobacter sp. SW119]|uniref:Na/Pi cotransporter family protein n=1 Tax=Pararhodobacter sp. SW119 TaxID=2780075 RepID=UPI001ADF4C9E|nr:Na/Pi symporter [Pararhodobacter sp. SW119]
MSGALLALLGGVGLFLYGMHLLTQDLRVLVSGGARDLLRRSAGRPVGGILAGAAVTAIIQSSSATMVMTLGFVGAGILSFSQSLGIVLGANIGTTFTGWMVMALGVKVSLGTVAYPALFVAALAGVLGSGRVARLGGVVAALCLIFIGIELMKEGMGVFDGLLQPEALPTDTLLGRAQLVLLGIFVTVVTQSSSAGVAAAIVLLSEGHLNFAQAAAMVIGMTVGTTFTGILASLGGTVAMRRTALANLIFNLTKGTIALLVLDLLLRPLTGNPWVADPTLALVLFHTGFTIVGALLFLPFVAPFARLIERLVPDRPETPAALLDPRFKADPPAALDLVLAQARSQFGQLATSLGGALSAGARRPDPAFDASAFARDMEVLIAYLSQISLPDGDRRQTERYGELMSMADHLRRLGFRAGQCGRMTVALYEPLLRREARYLGAILRRTADALPEAEPGDGIAREARDRTLSALHKRLHRGQARLGRREDRLRRRILSTRAAPPRLFAVTDALRWLRRSTAHAERLLAHLRAAEAHAERRPPPAEPAADGVADGPAPTAPWAASPHPASD